MEGGVAQILTIAFSLVSGTAAVLLSLLVWEKFRRSPFGRAVLVLLIVMTLFTLYHVFVLVSPAHTLVLRTIKSVLFTGVTVFIWMTIVSQRRVRTSTVSDEADR